MLFKNSCCSVNLDLLWLFGAAPISGFVVGSIAASAVGFAAGSGFN